jgi:ABC-type transport system involved in multi-copper enzyme maturation permease subunit
LFLGPVFAREAFTTPRRARHYVMRGVYVAALLILMATAWLVVAGTQIVRNVGDLSRFGAILFQILAPLQLALAAFLSALVAASAVCQEKDRRTLILLLMTRMTNPELVLGKLAASLLNVVAMLIAALPVFLLITLFGGVSLGQVWRAFAVTLTTAIVAGSLGSTLALWREKTFQTLAITALILVLWIGLWEAVYVLGRGGQVGGIPLETAVTGFSPLRAVLEACAAGRELPGRQEWWQQGVGWYLALSVTGALLLNAVAVLLVRVWNPSRELRPEQAGQRAAESSGEAVGDLAQTSATAVGPENAEAARAGHVDARVRTSSAPTRRVWDNPVLWREVCTWAYGRKVLLIRLAFLLVFMLATAGLYVASSTPAVGALVPPAAKPLAPLFLVSLVLVNALAVTSITNERDGQALDLLLVTDVSPREFVLGKLWGVFWITKEMVVLPMLLCGCLWWWGGLSLENLCFVLIGLAVVYVFVNMLGIHCGMNYANSRMAIGVSLGVVFFLFLGVVTCLLMMVSFSGSFQMQLLPFVAFIVGGTVGLLAVLGYRNPSYAIQLACLFLPAANFYCTTSFLLNQPLGVCSVTVVTYGFATAAMMVPAIANFDFAMGRTRAGEDE